MTSFVAILLSISGVCGAIMTIAGFITFVLKKPKEMIKSIAAEAQKEENKEIKELLESINEKIDSNKEGTLACLRHEITELYYECSSKQAISLNTKKDLIGLYEAYIALGGNSYIKELWKELENIPIEKIEG
mgnify:FL=1